MRISLIDLRLGRAHRRRFPYLSIHRKPGDLTIKWMTKPRKCATLSHGKLLLNVYKLKPTYSTYLWLKTALRYFYNF